MNSQIKNVTSFDQISLPYLRAFIGLCLIFLSLFATIGFLSQGFDGLAFLGIVVFCLSIEVVKILFSGDIGFYLALKMPEKALFAVSMVGILFMLSIGSETWFLMNGGLKQSTQLENVSNRTATLQSQIDLKQAQLAACNPNYLTKCVNPRTVELQALEAELSKAQQIEATQTGAMATQKFWVQIAKATGTSPDNLQLGLNLLRSILQELFGLYLFAQFSTFKRLQSLKEKGFSSEIAVTEKVINPIEANQQDLLNQIEQLKALNAELLQQKQIEQSEKKD